MLLLLSSRPPSCTEDAFGFLVLRDLVHAQREVPRISQHCWIVVVAAVRLDNILPGYAVQLANLIGHSFLRNDNDTPWPN